MCKSLRRTHGTAARSVPVAEMIASEARHSLHAGGRGWGRVSAREGATDPTYSLFPGDRSRESCGTWQLPQTTKMIRK